MKPSDDGGREVNPGPAAPLRYVVLHHTGIPQPHFDLMLEISAGGMLHTWRCPHWPPVAGEAFTALAEHRREYLKFEGALSGSRGQVRRIAEGEFKIESDGPGGLEIQLAGMRLLLPGRTG